MMPVMNGWEFRAEQLQQPAIASIPIVAFSGGVNVQQAAVALGAAAALRKPVGPRRAAGRRSERCWTRAGVSQP